MLENKVKNAEKWV